MIITRSELTTRRRVLRGALLLMLGLPVSLGAQSTSPAATAPNGVTQSFQRFADIFGSRLVAAFDSIPPSKYDYRPMPTQQSIGYIAQHVEEANYALCERFADLKHPRSAKDSLADTVKARWPKDTLVSRLRSSLQFCDAAIERMPPLQSAALASSLLAFEADLAEHYSQLATYMRLLGMIPPSALPPRQRATIPMPASALSAYEGAYELSPSVQYFVTREDDALMIRSTSGGPPVRLWPESSSDFFVKEVDAQVTFERDAAGRVSAFVLHQYGRDRTATEIR